MRLSDDIQSPLPGGNKNAERSGDCPGYGFVPGSLGGNLFAGLPQSLPEEWVENLAVSKNVRIERIVSTGQASPPGFWYDQPEHEWVVVLRGEAILEFEGETEPQRLSPGDYVVIPAHRKHRVAWTSPDEPTVWLAVFFE